MTFQFNIFCTFLLILSTIIIRDSYLFIILMSSTALYSLGMFLVFFFWFFLGFFGNIYLNKMLLQFQHQVFYFLVVLFFCLRFSKINFHILESSVLMVLIDPLVTSINFSVSALILWKISSFTSFATFCFNLQYHNVSYLSSFLLRTY